jgi:DNA repair exonuclease SbcCD ATPase subunit
MLPDGDPQWSFGSPGAETGSGADMDGSSNVLSPLVRSLQGRLERAEEQVKRAREREKNLRERLEGDDVTHLLAAQRAQSEALRRENDSLRDRLKEAEEGLESKEATIRRLTQQLADAPSPRPAAQPQAAAVAVVAPAQSDELRKELERMKAEAAAAEANANKLLSESMQLRLSNAEQVEAPSVPAERRAPGRPQQQG